MMIIYNVTNKVEASIAAEWLRWMQSEHIPAVMATGCFVDFKVVRLLEVDDTEGPTYAVQYHAPDKATYDRYATQHATALRNDAYKRWGNSFIAFRSVMEVVQ